PPLRDILLSLGLVAVPVPVDEQGFAPDLFAAALRTGIEAVVAVPRAQNPVGAFFDQRRAADLQELVSHRPDVLVVEDDHAGIVSGAPLQSMIPSRWSRWAVIRSTSKILHPDLRLALVAGDPTTIARVEGRQALGVRWVSHILQALVAQLLGDPQ